MENKNPVEASTKPTFDIVENQTGSSEQATQEGSEAPTHGGNEDPTQGQTQPPTQGQTQAPTQGQTQPPTQGGSETPTQPVINAPVIYESELGPDGFVQLMQYARPPQANEPLADPNFYKDCLFIGDSVTYGLISYSSKSLSGAFSTNNVNAATSRFMTSSWKPLKSVSIRRWKSTTVPLWLIWSMHGVRRPIWYPSY